MAHPDNSRATIANGGTLNFNAGLLQEYLRSKSPFFLFILIVFALGSLFIAKADDISGGERWQHFAIAVCKLRSRILHLSELIPGITCTGRIAGGSGDTQAES